MITIEDYKKIRNGRHLIVLDTSILLELYRQPSNISMDVIDVLTQVSDNVYVPYPVYEEYKGNYKKVCGTEKKRFGKVRTELTDTVIKLQSEIERKVTEYHKHNYTDIKELQDNINEKISETKEIIKDYEILHSKEIQANEDFLCADKVNEFVENLRNKNRVGQQIPFSKKLEIAEEGELRFKNLIPPGYKDNEKSGIDKYGDLFVWKTILKIAKEETANILFLTNDVKEDWWERENNEPLELRNELLEEFKEINPHLKVYFLTLEKAFSYLAEELQMGSSKSALQLSATEYAKKLTDKYGDDIVQRVRNFLKEININELLEANLMGCNNEIIHWDVENVSVEKENKIITYYIDLNISVLTDLNYQELGDYPCDAGKLAVVLKGHMVVSKEEYSASSKLEQMSVELSEYEHIEVENWNALKLGIGKNIDCRELIQSNKSLKTYENNVKQMARVEDNGNKLAKCINPYYGQYGQMANIIPSKEVMQNYVHMIEALPSIEVMQNYVQAMKTLQGIGEKYDKGVNQ